MGGKIYCILFPIQQKQIGEWCWGSCGNGLIGALDLGEGITAIGCHEDECPHLDRQMDEPFGSLDGRDVILRKLKDVTP